MLIATSSDDTGAGNAGAVYLYDLSGNLLQTFLNPAPATLDLFGSAVAALDGNRFLIGARGDDVGVNDSGAVYLLNVDTYTPGLTADRVRAGGVTAESIAAGAVTAEKIANSAVGTTQLAAGSVQEEQLAAGAVTAEKIALGAVNHLGSPDGSPLQALQVNSNGFVGIGTNAPTQQLHVHGNILATGAIRSDTFQTAGGGKLLSTGSGQPLEIFVRGERGLRIERVGGAFDKDINFIGGFVSNNVGTGTEGAVIAGGGADGGFHNVIGANSDFSVIGGGRENVIRSNSFAAVISGGRANQIDPGTHSSVIIGGEANIIASNAQHSVIPGGAANFIASGATGALAAGFFAAAGHSGAFVWGDNATSTYVGSTNANSVTFRASGGVRFFSSTDTTAPAPGVALAPGASSWGTISDRNAKKDLVPVDGLAVLEKLAKVPLQHWHYQWEENSATPHIGPMAQDFKAAFYPGRDDKSITTLEFDGVALAAIQGLNQKVEAQAAALKSKDTEIAALKSAIEELRRLVLPSGPSASHKP